MAPQPPAVSTPSRRREGNGSAWRESHHNNSSAPYPYDYEMMSPRPYGDSSSRGPPPSVPPYHYGDSNNDNYPPGPPTHGPPGGQPNEYWMSPAAYSNEYPPPPPQSRGSYWGAPPSSPYDGYRGGGGGPPLPLGFPIRGPPHQHMPHPSQQQHRSPSRRGPYGGEQQGGLELRIPPSSSREHHLFQQQRKDFSPPAPTVPTAAAQQSPTTRGVQVTVSASADSEETSSRPCIKQEGVGGSNDTGDGNNINHVNVNNGDTDDVIMGGDSKQNEKGKGDPLSVLADVSAGLGGKNKQEGVDTEAIAGAEAGSATAKNDKDDDDDSGDSKKICSESRSKITTEASISAAILPPVPMPAPTSPLQRRMKPSPITPSQTPQENIIISGTKRTPPETQHQPITPSRSHDTSSTAGGGSSHRSLPPSGWEPPPLPHGGSAGGSGSGELYSSHPEYANTPQQVGSGVGGSFGGLYNTPSRRNNRPGMYYGGGGSDFGPPFPTDSPTLVERGSFDSHGDASSYRRGNLLYPPATPTSSRGGSYFYDEHPPPPPGYGSSSGGSGSGVAGYWDSGPPPYSPTYPPPNNETGGWNQSHPTSFPHSDPYYGCPPPHHGPSKDYLYSPPPRYGGPEDYDPAMYGGNPPPPHASFYHYRGGPPPSILGGPRHPGMPPMHPHHMGGPPVPYPYGHPPRMEEKTILRKKFSWKHYPELERFLIANRDEYLKHSNMNYTAEQKQYNNWLTERLLELAGQHNYMFDPEDFNFVAIRDRIRCYYKSYVQTARKRGLKLPDKKGVKSKQVPVSTTELKKE
eukprot:CAMPEP_0170916518 /NCGR_PEP_ID=MMETSP0735-20130129/6843_1 /TAXON_ID=186038 /ORGANISM="Fragilariopsis kerguelensis, Strain L26-C5" /LENGTH=799 /DNA_ID=CAMNT_0011314637 /DNA_START=169 /DNA_END=2568 /DNA_ORIENTATION=+